MKNAETWKPTKFVEKRTGVLTASRDPGECGVSSRVAADSIGRFYSRVIPEHAHGDLLDLGCGTVPLYGLYSRFVESTTCADWENSQSANPHIDVFVDLNELPLPFADSSADTLLLSDVLEHVMHPWELMEEVARILRPGGVLLLNVPFYYPLHSIPYDYHRFTEFALRAMCARAGLEVIELAPTGGAPEILADVSSKVVSMLPKIGKGIARVIQGTTALFLRGRFGRKVSTTTGTTFPLAYAMVARKSGKASKRG